MPIGPASNWQFTVEWDLGARQSAAVTTFHYKNNGESLGQGACDNWAGAFNDAWQGSLYSGDMSEGWILGRVSLYSVFEQQGPFITAVDEPGGDSSNSLPNQVSPYWTLLTDHGGRSGRGRAFFPPPCEASSEGINLGTPAASNFVDFADALVANVGAALPDLEWCVWSRKDEALYTVVQVIARPVYGTQRRRQERFM